MYFQGELTQINLQTETTTLQKIGRSYRYSSSQSHNEHLPFKNPQWTNKCINKAVLIHGYKLFFQCQTKIVILLCSSNKAYWKHLILGNLDRECTTMLRKADKGLNSSRAQTWAKGSTAILPQVPAFVAEEKKTCKEGTNSSEKG